MSNRFIRILCRNLDEDGQINESVLAIQINERDFETLCRNGYGEDHLLLLDIVESGY